MTVRIAVARAAEPLVVPTKPSSLGTHGANIQHGRRGAPARDRCLSSSARRPVRRGACHPGHRPHRPGRAVSPRDQLAERHATEGSPGWAKVGGWRTADVVGRRNERAVPAGSMRMSVRAVVTHRVGLRGQELPPGRPGPSGARRRRVPILSATRSRIVAGRCAARWPRPQIRWLRRRGRGGPVDLSTPPRNWASGCTISALVRAGARAPAIAGRWWCRHARVLRLRQRVWALGEVRWVDAQGPAVRRDGMARVGWPWGAAATGTPIW